MVVDTSALVAILRHEPERDTFLDTLATAEEPVISAATLLEASMVLAGFRNGIANLDELLATSGVQVMAVDAAQALAAREAWLAHGKGRGNAAKLNFGDCFSYALAVTTGRPLLYKGDDFAQTGVVSAA
jgi:ribonuclease VapC